MSGWLETYRGAVSPWECDVVEHLTVAYYFDRFADATLAIMEDLGLGPSAIARDRRGCATVSCYVRYLRELSVGDILHIDSAVIGVDDKRITLGHRVIDSATDDVVATVEQVTLYFDTDARRALVLPAADRERIAGRVVPWEAPPPEPRAPPVERQAAIQTYRDTTKPWEIDLLGHVGFQFFIHRFSAASAQIMARMGLTPAFLRSSRHGMSTFEFQLKFLRELGVGDMVAVRSFLMHLGRSSFRFLHRMENLRTGKIAAELSQFGVLLDLDQRRPAPLPDDARLKAKEMMAQ